MVARSGGIIASGVHQLDDGSTLVHGTIGSALHMVAGIHQQDLFAGVLVALLQGSDGSIGQLRCLFVDVGMHIVGVQNGDLRLFTGPAGGRSRCAHRHGDCSGGDTGCFQEVTAGDKMFHGKTTSSDSDIPEQALSPAPLVLCQA